MTQGENGASMPIVSPYEAAMDALSSLISDRSRTKRSDKEIRFGLIFEYLKILDLAEPFSKLKIIHVAGTKGKGSTCTFTESILRNCGFRTGLFTSPHLIDIRERYRLDGVNISEEKFLTYFWWCWNRFKENTGDKIPMPPLFRFLCLLSFKIFIAEQVDVAILEVGLGGKFDDTNVVQTPVVCGISSLGYDHMEILGNTLGEIAGQKAGIFKQGVPAFTVPQPDEAMRALEEKASQLDVQLQVVRPLDVNLLNGLRLGLDGDHQYLNAGLAVALCSCWLQRTGHVKINCFDKTSSLSEQFLKGLTTATLQGRCQIVPDLVVDDKRLGDLVFYLDGAHTPESMEVCAKWFSTAAKREEKQLTASDQQDGYLCVSEKVCETLKRNSSQILLFNCMTVRDPQLLLLRLMKTCSNHGIHFGKALFVPNISVYNKVLSGSALPLTDSTVDLSWQLTIQNVWEKLVQSEKGGGANNEKETSTMSHENSMVFPSLTLAVKWLREIAQQNKSIQFQVLVTGSIHLVGDVLRLIKK